MFKSWKTTVTGVAAIVLAGLVNLNYISAEMGATISGLLVGVLGVLAKDSNITGGTAE